MSNFTADQIAAAQAAQRKWNVPASVTLAQFAIESAYGRSMPAGSNNAFGIKAAGGQPFVLAHTREETDAGATYYIDAKFRKFATLAEGFEEHAKLLATASPYAAARAAWTQHHDLTEYVRLMGARYATAKNYATVILGVIHGQDLQHYDEIASDIPAVACASCRPHAQVEGVPTTHDIMFDTATLQRSLNTLGAKLVVDGQTGRQTKAAIQAFQERVKLTTDGVVGKATADAIVQALWGPR